MGLESGSFLQDFTFTLSPDFKTNLLYAGIFLILALIAALNRKYNPKFDYEGMSSNFAFISLFALLLFFFATFFFVIKVWFSIPVDGYMDYFVLSGFFLVITLIFVAKLILHLKLSYETSHNAYLVNGIPILFCFIGTIYSFEEGVSAIPTWIKNGIFITFAGAILFIIYMSAPHE